MSEKIMWSELIAESPSKSQKKQIEILEGALNLVSKEGVQALTLSNLARATKISKTLISYHYPELDSILHNLFIVLGEQGQLYIRNALKGAHSLEQQIAGLIKGAFTWTVAYQKAGRFFVLMFYQSTIKPEVSVVHAQILNQARSEIVAYLMLGKHCKNKIEAQRMAEGIQNLIVGSMLRMVSLNEIDNFEHHLKCLLFNLENLSGLKLPRIKISVKSSTF